MTSNEYSEHFERWQAELADEAATVAVEPDEAPVLVDGPEAQQDPKRVAAGKRPIVPDWARSKESILAEAKRNVNLGLHTTGYHAVRLPKYAAKLAVRAPLGAVRLIGRTNRWLWDEEGRAARAATVKREDYEAYRKLVMVRDRHVRWRGMVVAAGLTGSIVGAATLLAIGGPILWAALAAATLGLGWVGRPADKPLLDTAVVKTSLAPLTSEVVIRGLSVLGIAGVNQAIAKSGNNAIGFTAPIQRDGPGWRAEIDLPFGVTVGEVADRRDKLASGLGRPLGCVWPEGRAEVHPGRLVVWVGDEDMAAGKPVPWPAAKSGAIDLFKPIKFGTDPRGRWAELELMYTNFLIGSIPGMGKTFAMRVPLLAAALDPRTEMWVYELKGTGDLDPLAKVAHRFASGQDDPDIEQAYQGLKDLRAEIRRRAKVIKSLPKDVCPENKVTPELAAKKSLGLHPLVLAIDECQELFSHPEFGADAGEQAEKCIKLGRALGVILVLSTQRPDAKSLPTGVSSNAGTRFCLRVMGQMENDMVLGTSSYKNGIRATMFTKRDKGVGYLVGASDDAQIIKTAYIDAPTADRICDRARAARAAAGRLGGYAAGQTEAAAVKPEFDLLADLVVVFPAKEKTAWNSTLVDLLTELRPDHYGHRWASLDDDADKTAALTGALKDVKAEQIVTSVGRRIDGKATTRRGINRDTLREIVTLRDGKPGAG